MCCFARLEKNMECYLLKVVLLRGCFHVFYIVQMVQNHVQLLKYFIKTNRQWHKVCSSQVWLLGIFSCESAFRGYCAPVRGDYSLARNVWNGGKIGGGEGGGGGRNLWYRFLRAFWQLLPKFNFCVDIQTWGFFKISWFSKILRLQSSGS